HEIRGAEDRTVHMRLRGEVHHQVHPAHDVRHKGGVADVAADEPQPGVVGHRRQVRFVARVGELVQHDDLGVAHGRIGTAEHLPDVVRSDEACPTGYEDAHVLTHFRS